MKVITLSTDQKSLSGTGGEQRSFWVHEATQQAGVEVDYFQADFHQKIVPLKGSQALANKLRASWYSATGKIPRGIFQYKKNRVSQSKKLWQVLCETRPILDSYQVVQFEHCFAYPFFEDELTGKKVIYSSHNVEYQMMEESLTLGKHSGSEVSRLLQELKTNELNLVSRADLIYCCTQKDADTYSEALGKDLSHKLSVVPNGCNIPQGEKRPCGELPFKKWVLYVCSDHHPNMHGMIRACNGLTLPKDTGIVVAGNADKTGDSQFQQFMRQENHNCVFLGRVSDSGLNWLYEHAQAVLLPIYTGGGSNIKTAEALNSERLLLTTPFAMRGFEQFNESQGLQFFETGDELEKLLNTMLTAEQISTNRPECRSLSWPKTIGPITELVRVNCSTCSTSAASTAFHAN